MKQGNRRSEQLLFEAELWASVAALRAARPYPHDVLDDAWREVLLLQFHDILPGTSIAWVHREAAERYGRLAATLEAVIADSLASLGVELDGRGSPAEPVETTDPGQPAPLVEPVETGDPRRAGDPSRGGLGELDPPALLVNAAPVAQSGVHAGAIGAPSPTPVVSGEASGDGFVLASDFVRVAVDADGHVVSAVDLASGREAIPAGERGNLLQLHQDFPNIWDAWDVDNAYRQMHRDLDAADEVSLDGAALPGSADRPGPPANAVRARLRGRPGPGHRAGLGAQRPGPPGARTPARTAGDVQRSAGADQRGQTGGRPLG